MYKRQTVTVASALAKKLRFHRFKDSHFPEYSRRQNVKFQIKQPVSCDFDVDDDDVKNDYAGKEDHDDSEKSRNFYWMRKFESLFRDARRMHR